MLEKLRVCSFIVLAGLFMPKTWADGASLHHDDAITSVTQFDQQLLSAKGQQDLSMFLSSLRIGDSQQDVDALLGTPYSVEHLEDGARWEYNISVPTSPTAFMGCQYRLEFDQQGKLRSADWRKSVCDLLYQQSIAMTPEASQSSRVEVFSLLSDVLFSFNQYQLSANGAQALDQFVDKVLTRYRTPVITITGHTDIIGSAEANLTLSKWRAREVGKRFLQKGVPQSQLLIKGMGEIAPVVECESELQDQALINCLGPNRRVEIEIYEAPSTP